MGLSAIRATAARHHFQTLDFLAHGFLEDGVGQEDKPAVQRVPRGAGSRTLRIHHPTEGVCLLNSGLHCMQKLASFESPKFGSEGYSALWARSRSGPCPLRPHLYGGDLDLEVIHQRGVASAPRRESGAVARVRILS